MTRPTRPLPLALFAALFAAALIVTVAHTVERTEAQAPDVPLKDAKLNIEHNATDRDTGFQGFIDGEGWRRLDVSGPNGQVLSFEGRGSLAQLGLTELFFETVEPENRKTSISDMLAKLPEGNYTISGPAQENGVAMGQTSGTALLTHDIPRGPKLVAPAENARVRTAGQVAKWRPVKKTITGDPVKIIAYQLIVEKVVDPHRHMIGKFGLQMYLSPDVTQVGLPDGFLEPHTKYEWEVLAIERSGNQTLSSAEFRTR
jgi:hypothetical protein